METIGKFITDSSLDKIFIISGLALIILSSLGRYKDAIQIDKGGRIFGASVGIILILTGLFLSSNKVIKPIPPVKVPVDTTVQTKNLILHTLNH